MRDAPAAGDVFSAIADGFAVPTVVLVDDPHSDAALIAVRAGAAAVLARQSDAHELLAAFAAARVGLVVIDAAVRTIQPAAVARGVQLDRSHCGACAVLGYRFRLEQVMINLLDNAVKFNRPEGAIAIECAANNGQVRISVADTGIGIPSDELNRIFERFYRVDKARSRPAGGTGLGLPIVKEVIDRMGGSVSVESQLGRGSRFTILLRAA